MSDRCYRRSMFHHISSFQNGPTTNPNAFQFFCSDPGCAGPNSQGQCTTGSQNGCPCVDENVEGNLFALDPLDWLDTLQEVLADVGTCTLGQRASFGSPSTNASSTALSSTATSSMPVSISPSSTSTQISGSMMGSASFITASPSVTSNLASATTTIPCEMQSANPGGQAYYPLTWCACTPTPSSKMMIYTTNRASPTSEACLYTTTPPTTASFVAITSVACSVESDTAGLYWPQTWCDCKFASDAIFPTQTASSPCAYTTVPPTVQPASTYTDVSCTLESAPSVSPATYCSCNIPSAPYFATMPTPTSPCAYTTIPATTVIPTKTTSTPPATPTIGELVCKEYLPAYASCWNAIDKSAVETTAKYIGYKTNSQTMNSVSAYITQMYAPTVDCGCYAYKGLQYFMSIGWIPGCTLYDAQVVDNPLGKSGDNTRNSMQLLTDTYNDCKSILPLSSKTC